MKNVRFYFQYDSCALNGSTAMSSYTFLLKWFRDAHCTHVFVHVSVNSWIETNSQKKMIWLTFKSIVSVIIGFSTFIALQPKHDHRFPFRNVNIHFVCYFHCSCSMCDHSFMRKYHATATISSLHVRFVATKKMEIMRWQP